MTHGSRPPAAARDHVRPDADWAVDKVELLRPRTYGGCVKDDPSLNDEQLETEIRLVGDLVLAASQSEGHLPQETIDQILGLDPSGETGDGSQVPDAVA